MARKKKVQVWLFRRTKDGCAYLLLKRPPNWHSGEFWQPVTGKVDRGEQLLAAARREVTEETGLDKLGDAVHTELVCLFERQDKKFKEYLFAFPADEGEVQLSSEHTAYAWLDFELATAQLKFPTHRAGLGAVHALLNHYSLNKS
jgi:lipoyl(octanoyl) transferase